MAANENYCVYNQDVTKWSLVDYTNMSVKPAASITVTMEAAGSPVTLVLSTKLHGFITQF